MFGEKIVVSKLLHNFLIHMCPFQNVCLSINLKHLKKIICKKELFETLK